MTEVFLIRHAQSVPTVDLHTADWPLSETGCEQARRLVPILAELGLDQMYSSPYRRCLQTIAPFLETHALELDVRDDLHERRIANTMIDEFRAVWRRSWDDFDFALEGGESSRQAQQRMVAAIAEICAVSPGGRIGISSHGNVIGLLLGHVDPRFGRAEAERLRNPDIVRVVSEDGVLRDVRIDIADIDAFATHHADTSISPARPFVSTTRLRFRRWHPADSELAHGLWGDPHVARFLFSEATAAPAAVEARLAEEIALQRTHGVQYWPMFRRVDGAHVGCCGLRPYRAQPQVFELGVHVRRSHWRQGFAVEAAAAVIDYAFDELRATALFAGHHPANDASRGLLGRLGFRYTHDEHYAPTGLNHRSYRLGADDR